MLQVFAQLVLGGQWVRGWRVQNLPLHGALVTVVGAEHAETTAHPELTL